MEIRKCDTCGKEVASCYAIKIIHGSECELADTMQDFCSLLCALEFFKAEVVKHL